MKTLLRWRLEIGVVLAVAAMGVAAFLGPTELDVREARELGLSLRERLGLRRSWFLGHAEMADLTTALSVVAASVDVYETSHDPRRHTGKPWLRFESALDEVRFLSRFAIGMSEVYVLPASFLLFEEENPMRAMEIVELGLRDDRTGPLLPMLAAFISHVFLRDSVRAGQYYALLREKHGAPEWIGELATKLRSGKDPIDESPKVREAVNRMIATSFPRAREFFERQQRRKSEVRP